MRSTRSGTDSEMTYIHGDSKNNRFYRRYLHVRNRCTFEWDKDYKRYGARGIRFEWYSYSEFKKDMHPSFLKHVKKHGIENTTIDRIDPKGNYSKKNCRWATWRQQSLNKTTSRFLTINGITKNYSEWAREFGCSRQALRYRVVNGLAPELVGTLPFKYSNRYAKAV